MMRKTGFTLVEFVVALALTGLVTTGSASAIFHLVRSNNRVQETLQVLHSLDMAGHWISYDGAMADTTDLVEGAPAADGMELYRTDRYGDEPVSHTTIYSLTGNQLQRNHNGQITIVAREISAAGFSLQGQTITVALSSSEEERTFQVHLRPN